MRFYKIEIIIVTIIGMILFGSFGIGGIGVNAAFNPEINYQGKLVNPTTNIEVPDGNYNIKFIIYDAASGGSCLWTARGSCDSETARTIAVSSGLFSVMLGESGDNAISSLDFNQDLWLGVEVNSDGEMDPRKKLGAVPAAFEADKLDGIDSLSFLRSDEADTMSASEAGTLLTVTQLGAGAAAQFGDGTDYLQISSVGNIVFVDANDGASIIGPAGGTLAMAAGASQALNITANAASTWKTTAGGLTIETESSGNLAITSGGTLALSSSDWGISTTGTITNASMSSTQLTDGGTISFDWVDNEVADALTVSGGTIGSNNISGTLTTTGALTVGDGGDAITIDSSSWDISSAGAISGATTIDASSTITGGTLTDGSFSVTSGNITGTGNITFSGSPVVTINNTGTMTWKDNDAPNVLMTLTDTGTTGNLNITGTLTVSGGTFDVSGAATDFEIKDNTASAFTISQSTNEYFNISTTDTTTSFLIDLPVAGSSSTTANLFTGNVAKTINLGTGTGIDTINIGTDATAADVISIGSSGAGNIVIESAAALSLTGLTGSLINFSNFDVVTSGATSIIPTTDVAPLTISRNVAAAANNLLSITESAADATGTTLFINQGGTGDIADFQSSASSILTVQDADRLKMRDKTLLAIGDINEAIIDDMEAIADWAESDDGNTDVALEETIVRTNDGAMKITTDQGSITGTGIAFVDGGGGADTITDTGNGFVAGGFHDGDVIDITGSTSNDGSQTIVSVVAGTITLATGTLTAEGAAATVTITGHASNTDTLTKTFASNQNYSVNDRIGFWARSTETGQIFSVKIYDATDATTSTHAVTIDAANQWQYEEWDISGIGATHRDAVEWIKFYIDDDTNEPIIYIDQLRYYDKDDRSGEIFVDGDGHLVLAGEQGIELQANITSSLPGLSIGSAIVEVNQPFAVNVAGDVGINYDLYFAGTGTSNITSAGPLVIAAGDPNHSENLTITTQSNLAGGDSGRATAGSTTTLTDSTKSSTWTADEWIGGTVSIVSGTGASQTQLITDNTTTVITVADWDGTLGDPAANSYYTLNYARAGDVLVNIGQTHLEIGGFKIIGSDSGSYVFKVSADGDVEIGGAGLGGSDLAVKQNISLTGGNLTIGQLDISEAGTLTTSETIDASGSCAADQYWYVVVAVNDNGTTAYGGEDDITTVDDDPTVTISWDPVKGATGYKIYRNTDDDWTDDDDYWVDGKVISSLDTTYLDDCVVGGDTASQTPPTTNTTGGDLFVDGKIYEGGVALEDKYLGFTESPSQGDILYYSGSSWLKLAAGTSGQFLMTQGSGANPVWASAFSCGDSFTYGGQIYSTVLIGSQCWMAENLNVGTTILNPNALPSDDDTIEKWCNGADTDAHSTTGDCVLYGGLYTWAEAMGLGASCVTASCCANGDCSSRQGICPNGWHIPTNDEWTDLERQACSDVGNSGCDGTFPYGTGTTGWLGQNTTTAEGEGSYLAGNEPLWTDHDIDHAGAGDNDFGDSGLDVLPSGARNTNSLFYYRTRITHLWSSTESTTTNSWTRALSYSETRVGRTTDSKAYGFSVRCIKD